jgi:alpha-galactosidase/6-phospho-beta-glucosidase family protein
MKLVLIGAGSYVFAPTFLRDIVRHRIAATEVLLVDLDAAMAELMAGFGRAVARAEGFDLKIASTTERRRALPGADYVVLSAAVQGRRRWEMDHEILSGLGIADQARECGGMGGLSYALRSIGLAMDVAQDMEELCPGAMLLDCTNPLPRVVTAVNRFSRISAVGFCNVAWQGADGYRWLARLADRPTDELDVVTAGLNHFSWLVSIRDRATAGDLGEAVRDAVRQGADAQSRVLSRWLDEYGALGVSGVPHMSEYLAGPFVRSHSGAPFHGDQGERVRRQETLRAVAEDRLNWRDAELASAWEHPADVAAALERKGDTRFDMLNIPNDGALSDLPDGRIVEVPAVAKDGQLGGVPVGRLPGRTGELCRTVSDVHEMVAEGAVRGDRALLRDAVEADPAVGDKQAGLEALGLILEAHADILLRFS